MNSDKWFVILVLGIAMAVGIAIAGVSYSVNKKEAAMAAAGYQQCETTRSGIVWKKDCKDQ